MKKAPKEDPPLLARPETPDEFDRYEPQARFTTIIFRKRKKSDSIFGTFLEHFWNIF